MKLMAVGTICAFFCVGCTGAHDASSGTGKADSPINSAVLTEASTAVGDATNGGRIFETNCATCHGATGVEGGVGPSLKDERIRKNTDATIAWIKNPQPPMPKLFPSPLTDSEVRDVATYVESL